MGLEEVGGFEVGGEVGRNELLVLTAGLDIVSEGIVQRWGGQLTTTVPLPHRPFQCPEM